MGGLPGDADAVHLSHPPTKNGQRQVGVAGAAVNALRAAKGLHDSMPKEEEEGASGEEQSATAPATVAASSAPAPASGGDGGSRKPQDPMEGAAAQAQAGAGGPEAAERRKLEQQQQLREREAEKAMQERLPVFVQLMWRMSALDVQVRERVRGGVFVRFVFGWWKKAFLSRPQSSTPVVNNPPTTHPHISTPTSTENRGPREPQDGEGHLRAGRRAAEARAGPRFARGALPSGREAGVGG